MKSSPICVWYLTTQFASIGGAERMLFKVLSGLPKPQFAVSVITLYESGDLAEKLHEKGTALHTRLVRNRWDMRLLPRLCQLARKERPDIVLTTTNAISYFSASVLRQFGFTRKLVVSFRVTYFPRKHHRFLLGNRAAFVDRFVALTPQNAQFWKNELRIPADKLQVIPNGIDTSYFVPPDSGKAELRASLGIPPDALVVGKVAYLKPVKNIPRFVTIARKVAARIPNAFFVLVGDGSERSRIETLIGEAGLRNHFLLPGEVPQPRAWYQAMDVFLLTSDTEALPGVLLEAGSCAVPAVATDVGGVSDVILHGKTGFVAPSEAEDMLADYVVQLGLDEPLRQRIGANARQRVVQEFSDQAMVQRYKDLFCRLAET